MQSAMKPAAMGLLALAFSACATQEGYRQRMDLLMGASGDTLLIDWGPPDTRTSMSDGRELWTYSRTTVDQRAGYWRDETRKVTRTFIDQDGKQRVETIEETFPVWEPPQAYRSLCATRFAMEAGRVVSVSFDGDGCVAAEIR